MKVKDLIESGFIRDQETVRIMYLVDQGNKVYEYIVAGHWYEDKVLEHTDKAISSMIWSGADGWHIILADDKEPEEADDI